MTVSHSVIDLEFHTVLLLMAPNQYCWKPSYAKRQVLYSCRHKSEYDMDTLRYSFSPILYDLYDGVEFVRVKNVWEFYNLIGWDWKKKKWIK